MKLLLLISLLVFSVTGQSKTIKLDVDNTVVVFKEINYSMLPDFIITLSKLNDIDTKKPIFLYINSPGGSVVVSEMIIEMAKNSRRSVHTVSVFAASAAFNLVQSLGTRYVTGYSRLLTHHAFSTFFPLDPNSIQDAKDGMKLVTPIYLRSAARMKLSEAEYEVLMQKEIMIRGEDNIKVNSADELIEISCSKDLILTGGCPN